MVPSILRRRGVPEAGRPESASGEDGVAMMLRWRRRRDGVVGVEGREGVVEKS